MCRTKYHYQEPNECEPNQSKLNWTTYAASARLFFARAVAFCFMYFGRSNIETQRTQRSAIGQPSANL